MTLPSECPRCAKPVSLGPDNPCRPFCSERCQKIDFGDWAAERYRVAAENPTDRQAEVSQKLQ